MSLFTPDTSSFDNYYDKGKFLLAWRISLLFFFTFILLSSNLIHGDEKVFITYFLTLIISIIPLVYLFFTKKFQPVFWYYAIVGTLLAHFGSNYVLSSVHYADFLWMTIVVLLAFIGLGKNLGIFFLVINSIAVAGFLFFSLNKHILLLKIQSTGEIITTYIEILFALFVIGYIVHQYILFQLYAQRQFELTYEELEKQNELITSQNKEKTMLMKEIHHRVKNNLQVIISLLRLQKEDMKSVEAKTNFTEAINRIMAISSIHQKLYQEKELSRIELKAYIIELSEKLKNFFINDFPIEFTIISDIDYIGLKTVVPLGVLLNELLSNSFKHAFIGKESGKIEITIRSTEDKFYLFYSDNGVWKNPNSSRSQFGIELISILAEQLNGMVKCERKETGTYYSFNLNMLDEED